MRRQRAGAAILAVAAVPAAIVGVLGTAPAPVWASAPQFGVIRQSFNLEADGRFRIVLTLPKGVEPTPTGFVVRVTASAAVTTREDVADAVAGELPDDVDAVELPPLAVPRPERGQMVIEVPVEVGDDTPTGLRLQEPGVHPVRVELIEGEDVTGEVQTFVNRLPTGDEDGADGLDGMPVAMAVATTTPVVLDDDVEVTLDAPARRELLALADLLEASAVPLSVRVPPAQLTALAGGTADDRALAERLRPLLSEQEVLSAPVLPLDVSLAAEAGQDALYTQWLRDGEDALARVVDAPTQRTLALVTEPLSRSGGLLLRNLGTRMLVLPSSLYDELPGTLGGFTDSTQLVQIAVDESSTVDAAVVDRIIAPSLTQVTAEPQLHAVRLVADLLAARRQVEDLGDDVRRHSVLLGTPDLSLPSLTGFAAFTDLLASTPGLDPVTVDDLSARTDPLLGPDGAVVVDLPTDVEGDLSPRIDLRNALGLEAISTGSMLPEDDPRATEWARLIDTLPTGALTDARATAVAADMRAEFDALRGSVVLPDGFSFRLTGTTGTVPITLRNDADIPLTVRVRMSSSKLLFQGDQTVELAPQAYTEVRIDIEARSNGQSSATLEVFTPTGDVRLGAPVVLSVSVTTLTGVGYLLTGAALLVLLTWWVRHIRRNRRGRRAAEAAERHPATRRADGSDSGDATLATTAEPSTPMATGEAAGGDHGDGAPGDAGAPEVGDPRATEGPGAIDDPDDLSPDAATSTLPPS